MADTYTEEMNAALARSNIPITYMRWGTVQMLPIAHADIETEGSTSSDRLTNFINSFGDSEEGRQKLKQSADHMVVMVNHLRGPYSCLIFGPWQTGYEEYYATLSVSHDMSGVFVHEAGHCLGAMHDRQTMNEPEDEYDEYNYGYCLPNSLYATVMAYSYNCPAPEREKILHFSNPEVTYEGLPTGDAENNNARAITEDRDRTSQYGSNCFDGQPDEQGNMVNLCRWTEWSEWSGWTDCCCVEREDLQTCPTAPYDGDDCRGCLMYLWKQSKRTKTRNCLNALDEITYSSNCDTEEDSDGTLYETTSCDCTAAEAFTTTTTTTTTTMTTTTTTTTADPETEGSIQSIGYPDNYRNRMDTEEIVKVGEGKVISFKWIDFELEDHVNCAYDYVTIVEYEGEVENIIVPKSCGNSPGITNVTSRTNQAVVKFKSDGSVTKRGFKLNYKEVDPPRNIVSLIFSENFPRSYPNNLDTEYPIIVPEGKTISIVFRYLSIEAHPSCAYDFVMIEDSDGTLLLPKTCGSLTKEIKVTSKTNRVTVKFHTDGSVTRTGFKLEWEEENRK